jgi:hypothetical protein
VAIGSVSQHVHQITDDDLLDEPDDHDQNKKRQIEAADVRNVTPDWFQQRFSDPVKDIANHGHQRMTGVNDAERDQPTEDRRYEQYEKVEIQKFVDEQQQPEHVSNPYCGAGLPLPVSRDDGKTVCLAGSGEADIVALRC